MRPFTIWCCMCAWPCPWCRYLEAVGADHWDLVDVHGPTWQDVVGTIEAAFSQPGPIELVSGSHVAPPGAPRVEFAGFKGAPPPTSRSAVEAAVAAGGGVLFAIPAIVGRPS